MGSQRKKSKQLGNKSVVLTLSKNNTKAKINSLGDVELKYVSYRDSREIAKLLSQKISDRAFVSKVLFRQLLKPEIQFSDFEKVSDKGLEKLAKAFVKKENYTFKHFQDTGDFFKDFRQAIQTYYDKYIEELLRKTHELVIKSTNETLNTFIKKYIAESLNPIIEYYDTIVRKYVESLKLQIDYWQKWVEQNQSVFQNIGKQWAEFQKKYEIAEQKVVEVLQKYKWFVSPSMPTDFIFEVFQIGQKESRQDKAINKLFIDYFSQNNWQNLELLTESWDKNPLFEKRLKIIKDCIQTLKGSNSKVNTVNVIIPTLIAQIDGFLTDYLDSKCISYDCAYDDFIQNGKVKKVGRKSQFKKNSSKALTSNLDDLANDIFDDLANDIFLNILFQHSQKGKPLKTPFNFNRHKIMHGENVKYGRKDYLIRSFLLIDFLVNLE